MLQMYLKYLKMFKDWLKILESKQLVYSNRKRFIELSSVKRENGKYRLTTNFPSRLNLTTN